MDIRKQLITRHAITAFTMAAMLAFPCIVKAELSSEPADKSRIEKVSDEEIALLLEQQKLLVPSFLDMQQKLKLLHDELDAVKLQLVQLGVSPSNAAAPMLLATAGVQKKSLTPAIAVNQMTLQQDSTYPQNELIAVLAGMLFILTLWLGSRYYIKIKSRNRTCWQQDAGTIPKPASDAAPKICVSPTTKQPAQVDSGKAQPAALPPKASTARNAAFSPAHPHKQIEKKVSEDDSMLEEAGLYAANGRMDKAAGILQEIIKRNPAKVDAWTLLLSVYSALCKVSDFESTAREFLKHHKTSPSWSGIKVLGRTLDRDNPLYADQGSHISAAPLLPDTLNWHRPIGDILIEMGVLPKREILKYLDDFDPKQHGRFGGYLVARKAITIAQLDQALLQQQGVNANAEVKPGDLPSLQDIEKFLVDFDPKQHGSVSKFLASHNIVTPEQLGQLLRQTSNQGAAAKNLQADGITIFGELSTS
ncbi:MAG: hypothetical protein Q8O58_10080 [Gallionella sp.]|nr:hypothetical protein [Gallionella sp.]